MVKKDPYEVNHDFGFTFDVDSDEIKNKLDTTQEKLAQAKSAIYTIQEMITPLLENLMKEPEKATIKWPNRVKKVKEFKDKLDKYVEDQINLL